MSSKQLGNLLKPSHDGGLGDIVRRARRLGEMTDALAAALPADCAGAIVAANLRDNGELVVIAASPAWANRLRYETDALLTAARDAGISASSCRVRVTQG